MKKFIFISVLLTLVFSTVLSARYISPFKGQKEYLKKCRPCHHGSNTFVPLFTQKYWKEMMENKGEKLVNIHKNIDKSMVEKEQNIDMIHEYFASDRYKKKFKYLNAFVIRFAKDGPKSPTTGK